MLQRRSISLVQENQFRAKHELFALRESMNDSRSAEATKKSPMYISAAYRRSSITKTVTALCRHKESLVIQMVATDRCKLRRVLRGPLYVLMGQWHRANLARALHFCSAVSPPLAPCFSAFLLSFLSVFFSLCFSLLRSLFLRFSLCSMYQGLLLILTEGSLLAMLECILFQFLGSINLCCASAKDRKK